MALFMITKSTYLKGRQCLKRQWFTARGLQEPEIEPDELWEERLREGAHVEGCAERLFPGGLRISPPVDDDDTPPRSWRERLNSTRDALGGSGPNKPMRSIWLLAINVPSANFRPPVCWPALNVW